MYERMTYRDYTYDPHDDVEDDCIKRWHDIINPDGETVNGPWGPYDRPRFNDFKKWVEKTEEKRIATDTYSNLDHLNQKLELLYNVRSSCFDVEKLPAIEKEINVIRRELTKLKSALKFKIMGFDSWVDLEEN